jgi:hypothetical protein
MGGFEDGAPRSSQLVPPSPITPASDGSKKGNRNKKNSKGEKESRYGSILTAES